MAGSRGLMPVAVMHVRVVWMLVQDPRVPVPVAMGLSTRIGLRMVVLVMDVVHVAMLMREGLMQVLVIMGLDEVQVDTDAH